MSIDLLFFVLYIIIMIKNKLCRIIIGLTVVCAILLISGCPITEEEEDLSISKVTIKNIPAEIKRFGSSETNPTFKVYINASNHQSEYEVPKAQGFAKIEDNGVLQSNGTYTITIDLKKPKNNLYNLGPGKPNPDYDPAQDPNIDLGPWKGTAYYFSVMISPMNAKNIGGINAIWIKGSPNALNKTTETIDWESDNLVNFREDMSFSNQANALYRDIINRDPELLPSP